MCNKSEAMKPILQVRIDPITVAEVSSVTKTRIKEVWDCYSGADSQTVKLHENEAAFKS